MGQRADPRPDRALGVVILAGFVALERRTTQPLADIDALKQPLVLMTNIATLLVGFGMFGSFILIPQLAEAPEASGMASGSTRPARVSCCCRARS